MGKTVPPFLKKQLKGVLTTLFYKLLLVGAQQVRGIVPKGPLLVIAPHPDDETLGCGGVIAAHRKNGFPVHIVVVTDGGGSSRPAHVARETLVILRQNESYDAARCLGVAADQVAFLGTIDGQASNSIDSISQDLAAHIAQFSPALILAPYAADFHPDHQAVARALDLCVTSGQVSCPIWDYPMWFWPRGALRFLFSRSLRRTIRLFSLEGERAEKQAAIAAYVSQIPSGNKEKDAGWEKLTSTVLTQSLCPYEMYFERMRRS